jgi:hypothetical protein
MLTEKLPDILTGYKLIITFCAVQFMGSLLANSLSYETLNRLRVILRARKWEKNGQIYQDVLRIKLWKNYIPAVGAFDKKHLVDMKKINDQYTSLFILEAVRAEITHLCAYAFTLVLIPMTNREYHKALIIYGLVINLPCFIIQRYNIPRFESILKKNGLYDICIPPEKKHRGKSK